MRDSNQFIQILTIIYTLLPDLPGTLPFIDANILSRLAHGILPILYDSHQSITKELSNKQGLEKQSIRLACFDNK